jgi:hypothetical protein
MSAGGQLRSWRLRSEPELLSTLQLDHLISAHTFLESENLLIVVGEGRLSCLKRNPDFTFTVTHTMITKQDITCLLAWNHFSSLLLVEGSSSSVPNVRRLPSLEPLLEWSPFSGWVDVCGTVKLKIGEKTPSSQTIWELRSEKTLIKWNLDRNQTSTAISGKIKHTFPRLSKMKQDVVLLDFCVTSDNWCSIVGEEGVLEGMGSLGVHVDDVIALFNFVLFHSVYRQPAPSQHYATLSRLGPTDDDKVAAGDLEIEHGCQIWGAHSAAVSYHSLPFYYIYVKKWDRQNLCASTYCHCQPPPRLYLVYFRPLNRVFETVFAEPSRLLFTVGAREVAISLLPDGYDLEQASSNSIFNQSDNETLLHVLHPFPADDISAFAVHNAGQQVLVGSERGRILAISPSYNWKKTLHDLGQNYTDFIDSLRSDATQEKHKAEAEILSQRVQAHEIQVMVQTLEEGMLDSILSQLLSKESSVSLRCTVTKNAEGGIPSDVSIQICCGNIDTNAPWSRARYHELRTRVDAAIFALPTVDPSEGQVPQIEGHLKSMLEMRKESVALPAVIALVYKGSTAPNIKLPPHDSTLIMVSATDFSDREGDVHPLLRQIVAEVEKIRSKPQSYRFPVPPGVAK